MTAPKTSTVNRVRTPHDDVVDAWWEENVAHGWFGWAQILARLAEQPEAVQRGVLRKARGQ